MQNDKDISLFGEEKDPFASIIDDQKDPFDDDKEIDPFDTPAYKQVKVEKTIKNKRSTTEVDNNDFFNPISTKKEDQIVEEERNTLQSYRILGRVITVSLFIMFLMAYLFALFFQWLFGFL
jgi:hypothetical protein